MSKVQLRSAGIFMVFVALAILGFDALAASGDNYVAFPWLALALVVGGSSFVIASARSTGASESERTDS